MTQNNPYVTGDPVGDSPAFVGRADIINEVLRVLPHHKNNVILLYGQRRIGKTSILLELEAKLPKKGNYCPVFFDLQDTARWPLAKLISKLAHKIRDELSKRDVLTLAEPDLGEEPTTIFQDIWLPDVLNRLPSNTSIVVLFDEFDAFEEPVAEQASGIFFPYLRDLLKTNPKNLNFVFVIGRKVGDLNHSRDIFKAATTQHVSLLNKKETDILICLSENNGTLYWSNKAKEKIWQLTHAHPYLTQHLCSRIWGNICHDKLEKPPTTTVDDVKSAIVDTLENSSGALEWLWDGLPPLERVVVSALAKAGANAITAEKLKQILYDSNSNLQSFIQELEEAPRLLKKWDLIEETGEGRYCFRVELLRQWIVENKPLHTVLRQELDRMQPVAEDYYQQGLNYYNQGKQQQAIEALEHAIRTNPNHVKVNQKLAEILLEVGKVKEAIEILERLQTSQPDAARTQLLQTYLIYAQNHDNDSERAEYAKKILKLAPKHQQAKAILDQVRRRKYGPWWEKVAAFKTGWVAFMKELYQSITISFVAGLVIIALVFLPPLSFNLSLSAWLIWSFFSLFILVGIGLPFLLPWWLIRTTDKDRKLNVLIYEAIKSSDDVNAKKIPIAGRLSLNLDGQIHLRATDDKMIVAKRFRIKRLPRSSQPMIEIQYQWEGNKNKHLLRVGNNPKMLIFSGGNYIIKLNYSR